VKLVEFTRDMRPHCKGETRVVPDDVAAALIAGGDATERTSVFDAAPANTAQPESKQPESKGRGRPYLTRKAR
jgi:hypothetical protein